MAAQENDRDYQLLRRGWFAGLKEGKGALTGNDSIGQSVRGNRARKGDRVGVQQSAHLRNESEY